MERMTPEQLKSLYASNRNLFLELANKWYLEDPDYYRDNIAQYFNQPDQTITPVKKKKTPWIIFIIAFCVLAGVVLMCSLGKYFSTSENKKSTTTDISNYPTVAAQTLYQDYKSNEVAADNKYKGEWFKINGGVEKIDKDFLDNIIVQLKTENQFMSVRCYLKDNQKSDASTLKVGDFVTMTGKGDGMIIGSPIVRNCEIISKQ